MYGLGLGVIGFGKVPWMEEQMKLRKIVYGQRAAILSFTFHTQDVHIRYRPRFRTRMIRTVKRCAVEKTTETFPVQTPRTSVSFPPSPRVTPYYAGSSGLLFSVS